MKLLLNHLIEVELTSLLPCSANWLLNKRKSLLTRKTKISSGMSTRNVRETESWLWSTNGTCKASRPTGAEQQEPRSLSSTYPQWQTWTSTLTSSASWSTSTCVIWQASWQDQSQQATRTTWQTTTSRTTSTSVQDTPTTRAVMISQHQGRYRNIIIDFNNKLTITISIYPSIYIYLSISMYMDSFMNIFCGSLPSLSI